MPMEEKDIMVTYSQKASNSPRKQSSGHEVDEMSSVNLDE